MPTLTPETPHGAYAHPVIEPAPVTDDLIAAVEAALAHHSEVNRHATDLTRLATDPSVAASLYLLLTVDTATWLEAAGPLTDQGCLNCTVDSYAKHGLIHASDHDAVEAAQTRIARLAVGFSAEPTDTELALLHHDPQSLVRAAYALVRRIVA